MTIRVYIYIQPTWVAVGDIFQGVSLVKLPPKVGIVPPSNYHEIDTYPLTTGSARPKAGLMD